MKLVLYQSVLTATFIVAKVSAEENVENSYMRPRSLAHNHQARAGVLDGDSFERVLQETGDEAAKIVPYESDYSKRPKSCDVLQEGVMYVGEHAKVEEDFAEDDYSALEPFLDRVKENLHSEMDSDEADEIFNNLDKKELMSSMFPHIKDAVNDENSRRLNEEPKLHESWDSEEEFDQFMAHAEYYIEIFPFDEVHQMLAKIDDMDRPSNYRNMTVEELHADYTGRGLSTLNHRQLQDDENLRAFVEARGHRVLNACTTALSALITETIALVISIMGISSGVANQAARTLTRQVMRRVARETLREIGRQAVSFGQERAREAITSLYNQAIVGSFSVDDLVSACTSGVSWFDVAFMVAEVMVFAACLVVSGGACFALRLALITWQIIQWFVNVVNAGNACEGSGGSSGGSSVSSGSWQRVDGGLIEIDVSEDGNHIWGISPTSDRIFYRAGRNGSWQLISGGLKQVSVSGNGAHVWGVSRADRIYHRAGRNGSWQQISGALKYVSVSGNGGHIWGVNSADNIYYRTSTTGSWTHISGLLKQVAVSDNGQHVWGVNSADNIYYRAGRHGSWQQISGALKYVAVAGNGAHVWGINSADMIYYRAGQHGSWQHISGRLMNLAVTDSNHVWGVNESDRIYYR